MSYLIETDHLVKRYGMQKAVDDVSLHVEEGEIYGLIGKNGAGKTTLMRLLLGLARPDSGELRLFGGEKPETARRRIGSLIEEPALYRGATAEENLRRFSLLVPTSREEQRRLLELTGLSDTGKKKAGHFSLGMKQRLGVAIALLGNPSLMILDEPVNGLDPAGIKEIRDLILELNRQGVTFLISSHLLDELGRIATRYGIMAHGRLVEEISKEELNERCRAFLKIVTDDSEKAAAVLRERFPALQTETAGNEVHITSEVEDSSELTAALVRSEVRVYELRNESISMEDYFIERLV